MAYLKSRDTITPIEAGTISKDPQLANELIT